MSHCDESLSRTEPPKQKQKIRSSILLPETIPNSQSTSIFRDDDYFDAFQEAERAVRSRQNKLNQSLQNMHERKRNLFAAERNIAIQKRTLSYNKRELDNHCCICGGMHIPSSGHVLFRRPECTTYKMKLQVYLYLSASLKKSNLDLESMKQHVQDGVLQNVEAKINMNQCLVSFVESSLCIDIAEGSQ